MPHFPSEALRLSLEHLPLSTWSLPDVSELGVEHLLGESRVGHVDDGPSPLQPSKGGQCLDAGDVGLVEGPGVSASFFPVDWQDLVQAALVVLL
eukprot:g16204.t1